MAALEHIRVPRDARDTLAAIAVTADEKVDALIDALHTSETVVSVPSFTALVEATLDLDPDRAADVASNFLSLATLRTSHQFAAKDLAEHVSSTAIHDLEESERDRLQRVLYAVLSAGSIEALGKAIDIGRAYDRLIHTSRVVTDIRPIFGELADEGPLGALIAHTLQFDYFADGRVQSISFALSNDDIDDLRRALDRAEVKESSLAVGLNILKWTRYQISGDS